MLPYTHPRQTPVCTSIQLVSLGVCLLVVLSSTSTAAASSGGPIYGSGKSILFTPVGANIGFTSSPSSKDIGLLLGTEASLALLDTGDAGSLWTWVGGYVDGVYDVDRNVGRFSVGPEVGWAFFGADAGVVAEVGDGLDFGANVRILLSTPILHAYGRTGVLFRDVGAQRVDEFGILLKFPFERP